MGWKKDECLDTQIVSIQTSNMPCEIPSKDNERIAWADLGLPDRSTRGGSFSRFGLVYQKILGPLGCRGHKQSSSHRTSLCNDGRSPFV